MKMDRTSRGFQIGHFHDLNGSECSIQDSSLADKAAIWFGVDNENMRCSNKVSPKKQQAWLEWYRQHEEQQANKPNPHWYSVLVDTRVHLDQVMVIQLAELFRQFLETGTVKKSTKDLYGCKFTVESYDEMLVVGPDDPNPQIMIPGKSWQPFECPEGTIFTTKMKLDAELVEQILPVFARFAATGTVGSYE